jgi:heme oxygenase (staphylobilin-producing)
MLIQTRTIVVKAGFSDQVVERFSQPGGPMTEIPGFVDLSVMVRSARRSDDEEEVVVMVRWESEEAWKTWEKSPAHIEGHRNQRNQQKPEYMLSTTVNMYHVKAVKLPSGDKQNISESV